MRKRSAPVFILVISALIVAGLAGGKAVRSEPVEIDRFYDRVMADLVGNDPEQLSCIGNLSSYGIRPREGELTDYSDAARHRWYAAVRRDLVELKGFSRKAQSPAQLVATDTLAWYLDAQAQGEKYMYHDFPADFMNGVQNWFVDFMINIHDVKDRASAENYIKRLSRCGARFDQVLEGIKLREQKGIYPPRFVVEMSLWQTRELLPEDPAQCDLYRVFVRKLEGVKGLDTTARETLGEAALKQIRTSVYPAYKRVTVALASILPMARKTDGVWALPDGDAYYRYLLRWHTTTDLTPEEIHQIGLREVARLQIEMTKAFSQLGLHGDSVGDNLSASRRTIPVIRGGSAALEAYRKILEPMESRLPEMFDLRSSAKLNVQARPAYLGGPNCYVFGNLDGTRPGVFWVNLEYPQYPPAMKPLAFHEGVPGHHMQVSFIMEQKDLPLPMRSLVVSFNANLEGWALYSERLADEFGFYETPQERIEALYSEYLRALRLVVDTGIHHKRWTRAQAADYLRQNTGMDLQNEVDRYIVMPGQACSYMMGELKMLALRDKARRQLGAKFDIRKFHNVILKTGSVPFSVLEREVQRYIDANK